MSDDGNGKSKLIVIDADPQWMISLVEDCRAIITEAVFTSRWALIEGYHGLGERIVTDKNLKWHAKGNQTYLTRVSNKIGVGERDLYRAIAFYNKYPTLDDVPERKNITWKKIVTKYLPEPKRAKRANGQHPASITLIHGDMLDVLPLPDKFNLVIADPPYNVTEWEWDKLGTLESFMSDTRRWLEVIRKSLQPKYNLFWFCSPSFSADIEMVLRELGFPIQSRIVWHRRNMALGSKAKNKFVDSWEMIFHCGTAELNFPAEWSDAWFDVQTFAVPQTNFSDAKLHPTQKPLGLISRLVEFGSRHGDRVLDPFAGSGTTGEAGNRREVVLIERDEDYIRVIEQRLNVQCQV